MENLRVMHYGDSIKDSCGDNIGHFTSYQCEWIYATKQRIQLQISECVCCNYVCFSLTIIITNTMDTCDTLQYLPYNKPYLACHYLKIYITIIPGDTSYSISEHFIYTKLYIQKWGLLFLTVL